MVLSRLRRLPHRPRRTAKSQATEIHGRRLRAAHTVLEAMGPFAHLGADSTVRSVTLHPSVGSAPSHGRLAPLEPPLPPSGCRPNAPTARSKESRRRHAWRRAYRYKCGGGGGGGAGSPARIGLGHIRPKLARSREGPKPTLDGPCPSAQAMPSERGSPPLSQPGYDASPARLGRPGFAFSTAGGDSHLAVHLLACVRVLRHTLGATPRSSELRGVAASCGLLWRVKTIYQSISLSLYL